MKLVPIKDWGKDHWSLLAYIETCCVDGKEGVGKLDGRRMRANSATHPLLAGHNSSMGDQKDGKYMYPTRLKGYFEDRTKVIENHDDWDCLDDIIDSGFVELVGTLMNPFVKMTSVGMFLASNLREHKANGGQFATFTPPIS